MGGVQYMRKGLRYRLLVLVSACFLTFGSFYCFAMPNVLASELTDVSSKVTVMSFKK